MWAISSESYNSAGYIQSAFLLRQIWLEFTFYLIIRDNQSTGILNALPIVLYNYINLIIIKMFNSYCFIFQYPRLNI